MPLRQQDQVQEVLHALNDYGADWSFDIGRREWRKVAYLASLGGDPSHAS